MSEMIERVARAICITYSVDPDAMATGKMPTYLSPPRLGICGAHLKLADEDYMPAWRLFRDMARAAIEAMREPTPEIKAISWCGDFADNLWRNMIDEVLK